MKRSEALSPLSRDHQRALYAALRLRRAHQATLNGAVEQFLRFFDDEGRRHFEIEEELLLPALPADDGDWSAAVARVREDHEAIRAAAERLRTAPSLERAVATGERLNDHVRFEERTLFMILEARLDSQRLAAVGQAIAAAESQ
jgi:hemerythrin HHE cation binding domain-containing protein